MTKTSTLSHGLPVSDGTGHEYPAKELHSSDIEKGEEMDEKGVYVIDTVVAVETTDEVDEVRC